MPGLVLAVFGPTASGKTAVAEAIAERVDAEVVSADSAALYRGLETLSAAPSRPTRLVGVLGLDQEASAGAYARLAHAAVDEILAAGTLPVVVGGTGLYLRAALADLELPPEPLPGARERWDALYAAQGAAEAHAELARRDPRAAARVHPNDRRRVVRGLELAEAGGSLAPSEDRLWDGPTRHPTLVVGLEVPREELERRIEARSHELVASGAAAEARAAWAGPLSATARKVMGLREFAELPEEEARLALVASNRRLAAYQRKWMRRIPGIVMIDGARPPGETADEILELARARQPLPRGGAGGADA